MAEATPCNSHSECDTAGWREKAPIVPGDLADTVVPEAYRRLRAAVEPLAAELGAQVAGAVRVLLCCARALRDGD
ncbi:hypothetical protein ACIRRA_22750 [Nocardia sp. NPDC101769]|uniref:hypothetical protein n=1 Tax=Nocardia sp. NPDC101769 TaxID=3364333 RepID=UPI003824D7FC